MSFSCDCDDREDEDSLPEYETAPDLALAALLTLMTSYPDHPTPAIARAIVNEPEVLLLDEPLGALDLQLRLQMHEELRRIHKETNSTWIFVTHDQAEAIWSL